LAGLKTGKSGNDKLYQIGQKIVGDVDYVTSTLKSVEVAKDGTLTVKQVGPGKVTEWANRRHAESSKKINDEIQGIEASLATRIGNGGSEVSKEVSGVKGTGNVGKGASEAGKHVDDVKILENIKKWDYPSNEGLYKKYENVYKNPKYYDQKTGEIHWPPNDGFVSGTQKVETLHPGMRLGRYGNSAGFSLAPERDSFPSRVLAPHSE